jgi:WD40 repeat protein
MERGGEIAHDDSEDRSLPAAKTHPQETASFGVVSLGIIAFGFVWFLFSFGKVVITDDSWQSPDIAPVPAPLVQPSTVQTSPQAVDDSIRTLTSSGGVPSIALSANGQIAINSVVSRTSGEIFKIEVWNLGTGEQINLPNQTAIDAAISSDGQTLVGRDADGTIKIWNLQTRKLARTIKGYAPGKGSWDSLLAISPDGHTLAIGSANGSIELQNLRTGVRTRTLQQLGSVDAIAISPDGQTLASRSYKSNSSNRQVCEGITADTTVTTWDLRTAKRLQTWQRSAIDGYYNSIAIGSKVIAVAGSSCKAESGTGYQEDTNVWNSRTGERIRTFQEGRIVAISPDGKILASLGRNGAIRLQNLHTGELIRTLSEDPGQVRSLVFSLDGKTLASGNMEGVIKVWSLP